LFVEIYLASQELDAAEQAIDELARLEENNALVDYYRARLAFKADQPEKCIEHLETYAKSEGTTAGEDAYELLDKDPANADLALYTARKFNALGDAENVQLLVEPLAAKPDLEAYRLLLDSYIAQERVGPLVALLGRIVETFGNITVFSEQVEKITNNEELSKKTFDEATRRLNDRRRPMLANESLGCSYLALANEDVKLSEKFFAHAEKNLPEEDLTTTRLGYAEECFFSEQNEPAIRIFRDVLQHPNDEVNLDSVVELLAMALEYDGQTEAALQIVDEHIKDNPSVGLAIRRAWIHYHAKQNDAARDAYESAINQYNDNFESTATRRTLKDARMVLSNLYVADGNIDLGTELLLQVLDEYPEDVGAMNDLGYLWSDNGIHLERSLSMIKKAVKAEPENAAYLDSLAWVYVKMNRPSEALPYLEEAIAGQDEPDGVILDHLGDVHLQLGNNDKAIQFWKQSLTSLGENDQPEKLKSVESKIQKHSKK
jgi:tetratricopeptide (TPR) repeat protein